MIFGPEILETSLGENNEKPFSDPVFWLFLGLMIPGMIIGAIGGIFGILLPVYRYFGIPMGKENETIRKILHRYGQTLVEYTQKSDAQRAQESELPSSENH